MRLRLQDKSAVVVGAGQMSPATVAGNGRATAVTFARHGARVMVVDRDLGAAQATAAAIRAEGGVAEVAVADVAREADCARLAAQASEAFGHVDVLHNNVGVLDIADTSSTALSLETWQKTMDINLRGMWLMAKHFLPAMRTGGGGSIINVSSIGSMVFAGTPLAYSMAKVGVNGLTKALAIENAGYAIRVNALLLGLMHTPMAVSDMVERRGIPAEEFQNRRAATVPMGRSGTAWDAANAALFLASDDSSYVTGALIPVDGGFLLKQGG